MTQYEFSTLYDNMLGTISEENYTDPYPQYSRGTARLYEDVSCKDEEVLSFIIMRLLLKYAYPLSLVKKSHFTIGYTQEEEKKSYRRKVETRSLSHIITTKEHGGSISLNNSLSDIYEFIKMLVHIQAEIYDDAPLLSISVNIYLVGCSTNDLRISPESEIRKKLWEAVSSPPTGQVKPFTRRKNKEPGIIPALKASTKKCSSFIVADTETVMASIGNVALEHVPFAIGFLVVNPEKGLPSQDSIEVYYCSSAKLSLESDFVARSNIMLENFISRLAVKAKEEKITKVYFHNFAKFDGIFLLSYFAKKDKRYTMKPLLRNNVLYEIVIYERLFKGVGKVILRFRDSLTLLPGSLASLGSTFCPSLGSKGSFDHKSVNINNVMEKINEVIPYMKQDIYLLAGIMLNAQDLYFRNYKVDITTCLTLSSLAMTIFRGSYYDPNTFPIYIPSGNADMFIRRGYYGGHSDVYKPYGENLYFYDVNSLYPYIMKNYPMPVGKPVWHSDLSGRELDGLFGFIEAYVECPQTINHPFLPYREPKTQTLIFPTSQFVGVFFSEELIYAKTIGYDIHPLRGYLFSKKENKLFDRFITETYEKRVEAKKRGDNALVFIYKILMNSLYGRFGINPRSTVTEVCEKARHDKLLEKGNIQLSTQLGDKYYMVSYISNPTDVSDEDWPRLSAVQISAAITASARIHMYKYISRDDCYYTDTDSAILGSPLPDDEVSSTILGKMKLEDKIRKGYFLAPKSYNYMNDKGKEVIKHKGRAHDLVDEKWFEDQYIDADKSEIQIIEDNFNRNWETLSILRKSYHVDKRIKLTEKRTLVYNENNVWIDTTPKEVCDYGNHTRLMKKIMELINIKKDQEILEQSKEIAYLQNLLNKRDKKVKRENQVKTTNSNQEASDLASAKGYLGHQRLPKGCNRSKRNKKKRPP